MNKKSLYLKNFIFGVEDSLVSTTGLLSGIAVVDTPIQTILLAGMVLIFVEALSMGVGSFLSEESAEEFAKGKHSEIHTIPAAIIMFFSYFVAGFVPLSPYLLLNTSTALPISILLALVALFLLGGLSAKLYRKNALKSGFRMLVVGGAATTIGILVGDFANNLL